MTSETTESMYSATGLAQARRRARWEIGDPDWANVILRAYFNPEADARQLREEEA